MIFDELHSGFRWYDSIDKQTRFKENCSSICDFALMSQCNDLLPFQIRTDSFGQPTSWLLKYLDGTMLVPVTTPGSDPTPLVWTVSIGTFSSGIVYMATNWTGSRKILGNALYNPNIDIIMANLVISMNTNVDSDPTDATGMKASTGAVFDNSDGYTASYNSSTNELTVSAPTGTEDSINSVAAFCWSFGGGVITIDDPNRVWSGGTPSSTVYVDTDTIDISDCIPFLNQYTVNSFNYLQYNGGSLPGCLPVQMDCGKWYSIISDGTNNVYSEVFEVLPISDIVFEQSRFPLFTSWRWYDSLEKQTRYKEYCEKVCNFYLLTGNDKLLPFQIRVPTTAAGFIWKLVDVDNDCEHYLDPSILNTIGTSDEDRITYDGSDISGLPCGKFYSVLFDGVNTWYSELIEITDAIVVAEEFFILQETGSKILQETLDGILQE